MGAQNAASVKITSKSDILCVQMMKKRKLVRYSAHTQRADGHGSQEAGGQSDQHVDTHTHTQLFPVHNTTNPPSTYPELHGTTKQERARLRTAQVNAHSQQLNAHNKGHLLDSTNVSIVCVFPRMKIGDTERGAFCLYRSQKRNY